MGDSFILPRACRGGLGPLGARYREEEEDVTNRGSDCVTTLIKMGRAMEGKQNANGTQEKGTEPCGESVNTEVRLCGVTAGGQYLHQNRVSPVGLAKQKYTVVVWTQQKLNCM